MTADPGGGYLFRGIPLARIIHGTSQTAGVAEG
jgi:hypothetical protein